MSKDRSNWILCPHCEEYNIPGDEEYVWREKYDRAIEEIRRLRALLAQKEMLEDDLK